MKLSRIFKFREGENAEAVKPFLDHLEDLRWVIIRMALALGVAMLLAFCFRTQLYSTPAAASAGSPAPLR